jgi:Holliday junction resolvase RusA-like endonuclease
MIMGAFAVRITLDQARFGQVDADNCAKAAIDLAALHRLIRDDRTARLVVVRYGKVREGGTAEVALREIAK